MAHFPVVKQPGNLRPQLWFSTGGSNGTARVDFLECRGQSWYNSIKYTRQSRRFLHDRMEEPFMNNWLNQLERKYGRFGIPNLTNILVAGQILVLAIELFVNQTIPYALMLTRPTLLHGQIWRLLTFVFIPFSGGSILSVVLGIYFTWFIGTALEREWGDFRYTVYFVLGMLGTILSCLVTGSVADTYCLSLSLLLAFAALYPEVQLLLFFVIPVRVKYFGWFAAALWTLSFLAASPVGKLNYLLCMLNVWVFFGPKAYRDIRAWIRREQWKRKNRR